MNRNDRSKLMMRTREFLIALQLECSNYLLFLEELVSNEENKLDKLPEGFSESSLSNRLAEDIENISSAKETVSDVLSITNEIPELLNIQIRKARTSSLDGYTSSRIKSAPVSSGERKTERMQLVLTPTLANALRTESVRRETSMNEIVAQILNQELLKNN